jgi:hypothetical protein
LLLLPSLVGTPSEPTGVQIHEVRAGGGQPGKVMFADPRTEVERNCRDAHRPRGAARLGHGGHLFVGVGEAGEDGSDEYAAGDPGVV